MSFFGSRYMLVNDHQFGSSDYSGYVISVNLCVQCGSET